MKLSDLRGKSRSDQFRIAAEYASVSPEVFDGIWATESQRGNPEWMLSPAGAEGHFGVMPTTRRTWEQRTGTQLDPNDFTDALYLSALQMRENMGATRGNLPDALRMYNGGTDRTNWQNKETQEYVGKVLGTDTAGAQEAQASRIRGKVLTMDDLRAMPLEQVLNTAPKDLAKAPRRVNLPEHVNVEEAVAEGLSVDAAPEQARTQTVSDADTAGVEQRQQMEKEHEDSIGPVRKLAHAMADLSLTSSLIKSLTRDYPDQEAGFGEFYVKNWQEIEKFAESEHEANWLRDAESHADLERIMGDITERRGRQNIYARNTADGIIYGGLATISDPAGLALGAGVGKAMQMAGVGSRALMAGREGRAATEAMDVPVYWKNRREYIDGKWQMAPERRQYGFADPAGRHTAEDWYEVTRHIPASPAVSARAARPVAGVVSLAAEGAGSNMLADAALEAMGEHKTTTDYALDGALGMFMGALASPFALKGAHDDSLVRQAENIRANAAEREAVRFQSVQEALGPDATPEQISAEVTRREATDLRDTLRMSLAPVPEQHRFLSEEEGKLLTGDEAKFQDISDRYDLAALADDTERKVVAELVARSEEMLRGNPIDVKATRTLLSKAKLAGDRGLESTGMTLLASESPVARSAGMMLLEGTTGAGGRRRTAAMAQVVRERLYNRQMVGYDALYHVYRKSVGRHVAQEAWDGEVRKSFNREVALEIEARNLGPDATRTEPAPHPAVSQAADLWERGMTLMREEQQYVGTVGAVRLGTSSVGYFTHKMDPRAIGRLTDAQAKRVRGILAEQFIGDENGFDAKFANKLAAKYLETATDKRFGMAPVPMNLHSPEAADIVRDALEGLSIPKDEVERLMGKFSRGGASHTKKRLRLDMRADIGDGMKLIDLFSTDITALYRSYARRTSGEVALAQYGIMGKKGLDVMKQAMKASGASTGDMEAFDQISSELLNTPFGDHNHKYMDNARIATSLSRLGGMGFTQFGEYANGLVALGIHRTFAAIGAMPRLIKEVGQIKAGGQAKNPILDSIDTLGGHVGLDEYALTRLFDIPDNDIQMYGTEQVGVFSRALRAGGNLQAIASGHRMITAVQTRGMAEQIIHKLVKFAREGGEDLALRDMGISPRLQERIKMDLPNIAEFDAKGRLTKLDLMKSNMHESDVMEMRDAIERGASQIIQRTYTGETGKWAHDGMLKLLFQFRTFSLTSVEKQWGRNVKNYGALKASMYLMGAMSFAAPIHMARVHTRTLGMSRSERDKYVQENLSVGQFVRATLSYASASGLLGDIYDVNVGAFSSWFGDEGRDFAETIGARGQGQKKLFGGVIAPGIQQLEDVWAGVHGDPHKLLRAMPFSNLPYIQPLVNYVRQDEE